MKESVSNNCIEKDRIERAEHGEYGVEFPKGFITSEINNKRKGRDIIHTDNGN